MLGDRWQDCGAGLQVVGTSLMIHPCKVALLVDGPQHAQIHGPPGHLHVSLNFVLLGTRCIDHHAGILAHELGVGT